jgi:hypothetical protein
MIVLTCINFITFCVPLPYSTALLSICSSSLIHIFFLMEVCMYINFLNLLDVRKFLDSFARYSFYLVRWDLLEFL